MIQISDVFGGNSVLDLSPQHLSNRGGGGAGKVLHRLFLLLPAEEGLRRSQGDPEQSRV